VVDMFQRGQSDCGSGEREGSRRQPHAYLEHELASAHITMLVAVMFPLSRDVQIRLSAAQVRDINTRRP